MATPPPASPGSGSAGGAAPSPATPGTTIALQVSFTLTTSDGLRQVNFGLEEDVQGTNQIWTINFELQERATSSDTFTPVVTLKVLVNEQALFPAAAAAAQNGLTPVQTAQALGPAADDAKATTTGELDVHVARQTVRATLAA